MIRIFRNTSIRALLSCLFGIIAILALILASENLSENLEAAKNAALIAQRDEIASLCLQAVKSLALERGRTHVVLQTAQPVSVDNRAVIEQRRQHADAALQNLLRTTQNELAADAQAVRRQWDAVRQLRLQADDEFARPLQARAPDFDERWLRAATTLIHRLEKLLGDASASPNADSSIARVGRIRLASLRFREVIGLESTRIAARLSAAQTLKKEEVLEIRSLRGRSDQLWEEIEEDANGLGAADFSKALAQLRHDYFDTLRPLQDRIVAAAPRQGFARPTLAEYKTAAVPTLDLAIDVTHAADQTVHSYVEQELRVAKQKIGLAVIAILLVVLVSGIALWVLVRRFTQPLRKIADQIDALRGHAALSSQPGNRNEFAAIRQALDLLADSIHALNETKSQLEVLAITDPLTGAKNRRHLFWLLENERQRILRGAKTMSVLLMDIDHFKSINDTHGHAVGDEALKEFVASCNKTMRPSDSICRYGGEEFVLLLPMTDRDEALSAAERLRFCIEAMSIAKPTATIRMTISIGVATYRRDEHVDELLQRADLALYKAKNAGRNRIAI